VASQSEEFAQRLTKVADLLSTAASAARNDFDAGLAEASVALAQLRDIVSAGETCNGMTIVTPPQHSDPQDSGIRLTKKGERLAAMIEARAADHPDAPFFDELDPAGDAA
jgi:hypothetical protein